MSANEPTLRDAPEPRPAPTSWSLRPVWGPSLAALPRDVPLTQARTLGRGEPADIVLGDPRVSRVHATITLGPKGPRVRDSSTNGVFVNGTRIEDSAQLSDGDVLRAGETFLVVRALGDEADADVPAIVGRAPSIAELRARITMVATTPHNVMVIGESGTGKELVARAIHERSGRKGPLVAVNCGAISDTLVDSQLFGHVAGAFTGASASHDGFLRRAHRGTLFLDELGEMPLALQPRLLRAVEERAVTPVGGDRSHTIDVRLIAATNVVLEDAIASRSFRGDLYARLADLVLRVPPLRERREDIMPLLSSALPDSMRSKLSVGLVEALLTYDWPLNVRELLKVAAELSVRGVGRSTLDRALIADRLTLRLAQPTAPDSVEPEAGEDSNEPVSDERIRAVFAQTGGNVSEMARLLGRSRRQARRYVAALGLRSREG